MKLTGPLLTNVEGLTLTDTEATMLKNPLVGGIILFARNYQDKDQLSALTQSIRNTRSDLIICVDHEGGRVQRFQEGFTQIPFMGSLKDESEAYTAGQTIANELLSVGVDFSFTPVLDLDYDRCEVIGKRAFSRNPERVVTMAGALIDGLASKGMPCVGKHFPGHGYVTQDSHVANPVDTRTLEELMADDVKPYIALKDKLDAIMTAHVLYPKVDSELVTFSSKWLKTILRDKIGYQGLIISDDLNMHAATADAPLERVKNALQAGCDSVLFCNNAKDVTELLAQSDQLKGVA